MAERAPDYGTQIRQTMQVVMAIIGLSIAVGVGYLVLAQLGVAVSKVNATMPNYLQQNETLINTMVVMLIVGALGGIGAWLIRYLTSSLRFE